MKILLALDGSAYTKRMLGYLGAHEEVFGANGKYTALTVIAAVPPLCHPLHRRSSPRRLLRRRSAEVLEPEQGFAKRRQWNATMLHRLGHAADVIAKTATTGKFDLLMMGSHGRSSVKSLLLGLVSSRVMALCATPTLIIR